MKIDSKSLKLVQLTVGRLKQRLFESFVELPANRKEQQKVANELIEFYNHEISKLKIGLLNEFENQAIVEVEKLSAKKQNEFYAENFKVRLEGAFGVDYHPEFPKLPEGVSDNIKFLTGTAVGGGAYLAYSIVSGGNLGLVRIFYMLCTAFASGVSLSYLANIFEKEKVKEIVDKYFIQEEKNLMDFSKRLAGKYFDMVEKFLAK